MHISHASRYLAHSLAAASLTTFAALGLVATAGASTTTLYAATNGTGSTCSSTAPCTLGTAISDATDGDTVVVEGGTYTIPSNSDISISTSITLTSDTGNALTSGTVLTGGDGSDVFSVSASNVTIEGFVFQDVNASNGVITVGGNGADNLVVSNNSFTNITGEAIGGHANGPTGFGTNPTLLANDWSITGNTVTNDSEVAFWLGDLTNSSIAGNTITKAGYAGILLTASQTGTGSGPSVGFENSNTVTGNMISQVAHQGIQVAYGTNVTVADNNVNAAGTDTSSGATIARDCAICLYDSNQSDITVRDNSLTNSYEGIGVGQNGKNQLGLNIVLGPDNLISGNTTGLVDNAATGSGTLFAQEDWWGCKEGPGSPACDTVVGNVQDQPFLTANPTTNSPVASTSVDAGTLGFVSYPGAPVFGVGLNGRNETSAASLPIDIGDATGSGDGWSVTATSTLFTDGGGHTLPALATTVASAPADNCDPNSTCSLASNDVSYPYVLPAGATAPTATVLANAATGTGMGDQTLVPTFSLAVPADAYAGQYSSTWTISLVTGP